MNYLNWDFLDDSCEIWCINLKYRTDRYNEVVKEFKKINILNKVRFYQPEKVQYGCWVSHKYCMDSAYKHNKNLLIFEDDVRFDHISNLVFNNIKNIYNNQKWDLFRLGGLIERITKIDKDVISGKFVNAHCLFIHKNYLDHCLNDKRFSPLTYKLSTHIDQYYKIEDNIDILLNPQIAWQRASDIDNSWDNVVSYKIFTNPMIYEHTQRFVNWAVINIRIDQYWLLFFIIIVFIASIIKIREKKFPKLTISNIF